MYLDNLILLSSSTGDGTIGGGEVLPFLEKKDDAIYGISQSAYWLQSHIHTIVICLLIIIILCGIYNILKIMGIDLFGENKVNSLINDEIAIGTVNRKQRRTRKFLTTVERFQSKGILKLDKFKEDDLRFNLERVNWRINDVPLSAGMYNGLKWLVRIVTVVLTLVAIIFFQSTTPFFIGLIIIMSVGSVDIILNGTIKRLDEEIYANFLEFYLMLHHTMISDGGATLTSLIQLYNKTAKGEMKNVTDKILYCFDTYGESLGCDMLTNAFRHEYISRLMRLIKGYVRGADVRDDMKGFRTLLIDNRERDIMNASEKLQMKARMSFYILMPILVQAIVSAMAIYFGDISQVGTFM